MEQSVGPRALRTLPGDVFIVSTQVLMLGVFVSDWSRCRLGFGRSEIGFGRNGQDFGRSRHECRLLQ